MRELMRKSLAGIVALVCLGAVASAAAQEAPKPAKALSVYRLDFAIHESENGQRINTRSYSQLLEEGAPYSTVRAGAKMPITRGNDVVYMDVGVRLDCGHFKELDGQVAFELTLEITSFAEQQTMEKPLLRNISSQVQTAVVPGKATVVTSIDDAASKRRYELEVTATKVK